MLSIPVPEAVRRMANANNNGGKLLYLLLAALLAVSAFVGVMTVKNAIALAEISGNRFTDQDGHELYEAIMVPVLQNTRDVGDLKQSVAGLPPRSWQDRIRHIELELVRRHGYTTPDGG